MATPDQQTPVADGDITGTVVEAIDSFDAMGLSEPLLRGIYAYGFEKPSALSPLHDAAPCLGGRCVFVWGGQQRHRFAHMPLKQLLVLHHIHHRQRHVGPRQQRASTAVLSWPSVRLRLTGLEQWIILACPLHVSEAWRAHDHALELAAAALFGFLQ
jgi:hypothetical protein